MKIILPSLLLLLLSPSVALAYIDPVSGSMAIQALIAVVAGALVAFRMYFRRVKHWVLTLMGKAPPPLDREEDAAADSDRSEPPHPNDPPRDPPRDPK